MTATLAAERIYRLLPAVYRVRDEGQDFALKALVALISRELEALEEDVEQLYDDQFVETCAEWAAPYIGELIGYRPLHGVVPKVASPRAEVANTIRYRRRKGTAAMLEQLARDVTDWPARAVEFFEQLATTQYMNHVRLHAQATAAARSLPRMLFAHGPFNLLAHTPEMRRPEGGSGRYNIPNVGIFLWRLAAMPVTAVPLVPHDANGRRFRFNPLGADQPLFRKPDAEDSISHIAEPANVPAPLRIRELALQIRAAQVTTQGVTATQDYGEGRSFVLHRTGAVVPINRLGAVLGAPAVAELRIADLRDVFDAAGAWASWAHEAAIGVDEIAVDPERGRVFLGTNRALQHAATPFIVSYHRGFSRDMAGGEYERIPAGVAPVVNVAGGAAFQAQLDATAAGGTLLVTDNLTYAFTPTFKVNGVTAPGASGIEVVVAAANGARPVIRAGGAMPLRIGARGRLVLDGFVIAGGALELAGFADSEPRELVLRHCTLVPGLTLVPDGRPATPGAPSLRIAHAFARVTLEDCIVGSIRIHHDAELEASASIIDACAPGNAAVEGLAPGAPAAELTLRECTVIGTVRARLMCLASNTLFLGAVRADRLQEGCVRFSFVPDGSIVPRRFHCLPDTAHPAVLPHFTSLRHAEPGYAQLRSATARAILEGADDGGEIGAMHVLHQPQREANLRERLDEYLRFGLHAGIFHAT